MLGFPDCPACHGRGYTYNFAGTITRDCDCVRALIRMADEPSTLAARPSPDSVRNLVKAGALIAAEIDRLQRAAKT